MSTFTHYTILLRDMGTNNLHIRRFRVIHPKSLDHFLNIPRFNDTRVPVAWKEGHIVIDELNGATDQDAREKAYREWIGEGRAIATFLMGGDKKRYVHQRPYSHAVPSESTLGKAVASVVDPGSLLEQLKQRAGKAAVYKAQRRRFPAVEQPLTEPIPHTESKLPTYPGLMMCSSDRRANDHLVQARFGTAL